MDRSPWSDATPPIPSSPKNDYMVYGRPLTSFWQILTTLQDQKLKTPRLFSFVFFCCYIFDRFLPKLLDDPSILLNTYRDTCDF